MIKKVCINAENQATFICDACGHARVADVGSHAAYGKPVKVKCTCQCGHQFTVILEKRHILRKSTNCAGAFVHFDDYGEKTEGRMKVVDISRTGLKLQVNNDYNLRIGDRIDVEFRLDDVHRTLIQKRVVIRNIDRGYVGTEFADKDEFNKALGTYLMRQ